MQQPTGRIVIGRSIASIGLLIAGCAFQGVEMSALPARIDYTCIDNRILPVARAPGANMAAVMIDNQEILLHGGASAAQEKYTDGIYTLYLDGEQAMLEQNGRVVFGPCRSLNPLPTYYRSR